MTTETRHLLEAASLVEADTSKDTWVVRLISEGKGSSGLYSATLLEEWGYAFNEALSYINHPTGWDGLESRAFTEIAGEVVGDVWIDRDERGKVGVYANWRPDPDHKEKLARYAKKLGMSIYIEGDGHFNEDGEFEVDTFNPNDPFKSVDVVIAAGRGGRFEITESYRKMYESARVAESEKRPGARQAERKEIKMDEELKEALKGITDALAVLVAEKKQAEAAEAQVEADEAAVTSAVEAYDEARKAIDEADLLEPQREALLAAAKTGKDITADLVSAKAVKESALEAAKTRLGESADADQLREFGGSDKQEYTLRGFGGK